MITDSRRRRVWPLKALVAFSGAVIFSTVAGCGQPTEVDRDNRRLLDAIITAVSMGNERWLADDEQLLRTRHAAGQLTDKEFQQLEAVIARARGGDWSGAVDAAYQFRKKRPFVREGH